MNFRTEDSLHNIFSDFLKTPFEPKKGKKQMKPYEQKFRKICQNLKLHLGSNCIETDIFKAIKLIMKRDFQENFESNKVQIFVPKVFLTKFAHVTEYDEYIKNIEELKNINDMNELTDKIITVSDQTKKENMAKKLKEAVLAFAGNQTYTKIRKLTPHEIQRVKELPRVRGERAEKKLFKGIQNFFKDSNEEILVFYNLTFMGSKADQDLKPTEKDFVLVNLTKRYIMPFEVKVSLNSDAVKKAVVQIEGGCNS